MRLSIAILGVWGCGSADLEDTAQSWMVEPKSVGCECVCFYYYATSDWRRESHRHEDVKDEKSCKALLTTKCVVVIGDHTYEGKNQACEIVTRKDPSGSGSGASSGSGTGI
jgi:hypothetical protein